MITLYVTECVFTLSWIRHMDANMASLVSERQGEGREGAYPYLVGCIVASAHHDQKGGAYVPNLHIPSVIQNKHIVVSRIALKSVACSRYRCMVPLGCFQNHE